MKIPRLRHVLVGVALDALDYLALGFTPIIGDFIDLAGAFYFYKVLGPVGLSSALELVPLADVLPTNILLGIYADMKRGKGE